MSAIDELKEAIEYACAYNESLIHLSTRTAQAILAALTWTPVEEGLPEMPKGDICTSAVVEVCNVKSKCFCEGYYDFGGEFWECEIEPTHWRYVILPKPRPCRACDKAGVTCLREIIEPKSCEACRGSGKVEKTCKECNGKRLNKYARAVLIGGENIYDLCSLSIKELVSFFEKLELDTAKREIAKDLILEIQSRLQFLYNVGLLYVSVYEQYSIIYI